MKFKLYCVEEIFSGMGTAPASHTTEFEAESLHEVIMNIELFLKGCGFQIESLDYDLPSIRCGNKHIPEGEPF